MSGLEGVGALAVVHARAGELPPDAAEVISEALGHVLILGHGAGGAAHSAATGLPGTARRVWWCDTGEGFQPGRLAARLAPLAAAIPLVVLPGTADGRDLAPRLAAALGRPLLSRASAAVATSGGVRADLCRLDGQVTVPAEVDGPAVVTMEPGAGAIRTGGGEPDVRAVTLPPVPADIPDVTVAGVAEPGPATNLAEAAVVLAGGAGLAAGLDAAAARAAFGLLAEVAAALGAAAGATRVATDAGWAGHDRQIGTTGVVVRPRLYVAFGVSGATQHTAGLGMPEHVASVNLDPHCPMTAMSGLGIVADARQTLIALAGQLGIPVPTEVRDAR